MAGLIGLCESSHAHPARTQNAGGTAIRAPRVELRDVTVVYPGGNVGLDGVSLTIERGEFAFLVGRRAAENRPSSGC